MVVVRAAGLHRVEEVAAEGNRGQRFIPPLSEDELAFYDAVAENESAVELQGEDVLASIARELVAVMRPLFGAVYGDGSTHVRNIERQIQRFRR